LPAGQLIDLCFSQKYEKEEIKRMVIGEGGYVAYLETNDAQEVEKRAANGDEYASKIQDALAYQVSKAIGEMAVVLDGAVDAILLTGGLAFSKYLTQYISAKVGFIAPVYIYPGEDELDALALNALRVATGEVQPLEYPN
jgi:butyrate kinase